jgi:hypothetical protein
MKSMTPHGIAVLESVIAKYLFQAHGAEMWRLYCQRTTKFKTRWFKSTEV